jgi:hypothetical protein
MNRIVAGPKGLEPSTSGLTGQRSNRTELRPHALLLKWWAVQDLNL